MNFLKRSFYAVTRKKGHTVILLIVFLVLANLVLTGIAIKSATAKAGEFARQQLGGSLTLSYDIQKAMEEARTNAQANNNGEQIFTAKLEGEPVTEEMASKVAGLNHIIDYNYLVSTMAMADGFTTYTPEDTSSQAASETDNQFRGQNVVIAGNGNVKEIVMPDVSISGVRSTQLLDEFDSGTDKLVEGRHITEADKDQKVVLIEKNLAAQNSLSVGSVIKLKSTETDAVSSEYTVTGIYETTSESVQDIGGRGKSITFMQPFNKIYTDYGSAMVLKATAGETALLSSTVGIDSAVFYVDDPKNIEVVKSDAQKLDIDFEKFELDANDTLYKQMMGPIDNVASFSVLLVILVSLAGAVILGLILMLSVKERKYETGVLLSMGEKKIKVISQYLVEVLAIAIVAFAISIFTGNLIADNVGNALVKNEINIQEQAQQDNGGGGFFAGPGSKMNRLIGIKGQINGAAVDTIDSIDVSISFNEVWQLYLLGILIIGIATVIPASSIMRYNPKTILTKAI